MIRINLLPHREEKRTSAATAVLCLLGLITVLSGLIVFLVYSVIGGYIAAQDAKNDFLRRKSPSLTSKSIRSIGSRSKVTP
jgi:type IV pilus assembly protein PilN